MNKIREYSITFDKEIQDICIALFEFINSNTINYEVKLFHGSPVWFLNENPIVGYSKKGNIIALLFWSGQSFKENGLMPVGKFKAAEKIYNNINDIDFNKLNNWLNESSKIMWNYKDIRKNNGILSLI